MREVHHNKLVRDHIPDIIRADGSEPVVRFLSDEEYDAALLKKFVEEAGEVMESNGSIEELADLKQVWRDFLAHRGYTDEQIDSVMSDKEQKRGGFSARMFLEKVVTDTE